MSVPPGGESPVARAVAYVAARSAGPALDPRLRVTLHFHPDLSYRGRLVIEALCEDGCYRSQFETQTSNGGLTAHPGGERWNWESRLFGAAYDHSPPSERPKYGSLDFRLRGSGGSPRFGSCWLRLGAASLERTTFCYPDSVLEPVDFGTASSMGLVELALSDTQDLLDDYVEAHVHGPVLLADDVEALVLDPCYRGGPVEEVARRLPCPVEWHGGFRLDVDELRRHPAYRGERYVDLGCRLARDRLLTPAVIGDAARTGRHDPQDLKRVWHYLARFGAPGTGRR